MKTRTIELSVDNRDEVIKLPINPAIVEFTEKQLNQAITLLNSAILLPPSTPALELLSSVATSDFIF